MKKNRILVLIFSLLLVIGILSGCGKETTATSVKKSVVCTIFPEYDWAKEVIGELSDEYELTLLLDNGVDLHSYQPTASDIVKIAGCDLFIYVGGESDGWVEDALTEATNKDMKVINLMDVLGSTIKEEEIVEGMQAEEEHDHEDGEEHHEDEEEHEESEEIEYDEHVWLSLKNAQVCVKEISIALQTIDKENASVYEKNEKNYVEKLNALDEDYEKAVSESKHNTLLFCDRFPFRYMTDDYHLSYYAAFVGCSAESEASFETVVFLAGKTDELDLKNVCVIEGSDQKIAKTVIENTTTKNQNILIMNSMQSTTGKDIEAGVSYLSIAEQNLGVLKKALN